MGTKASSNRFTLYYIKEATWGVTPASPALKELRLTGEQLDASKSFERSKEIRSDRMVADTILVDSSPGGSFNFEFSGATYDPFIESVMMSAWSADLAIVGVAGDISTAAAPTANVTSTTGGKFSNVVKGQWIKLAGFADALNNGFFQVTDKISNTSLTVYPQPHSAETPALAAATIKGSYIRNGTTEQSYTLVKLFADTDVPTWHIFRGQRASSMSLDLSTGAIITGSMSFMGSTSEWTETAISGSTFLPATTTSVTNSVSDVEDIFQDGATLGSNGSIMSLGLEIDNQHREQKAVGVLGNGGIAAGQFSVTGSAQQYFESMAQANKFDNATAFSFSFRIISSDGYTYIFTCPRNKYESFVANATGLDTDVAADTKFAALRDAATNCMLQIDRFVP